MNDNKRRSTLPPEATQVFKGELFEVYQWPQKMYDGSTVTFEKLKRQDTVLVIPVLPNGNLLLADQEQPTKENHLALLGGRMEEGEDVIGAAKRELQEESGYTSNDWEIIQAGQPVHKIDWNVYLLIARNCEKTGDQQLDAGEKITLRTLSLEELCALAKNEELQDPELCNLLLRAQLVPEVMKQLKSKLYGNS